MYVCLSGETEVIVGGGGRVGVQCVYVLRKKKKGDTMQCQSP